MSGSGSSLLPGLLCARSALSREGFADTSARLPLT